MTAEGRWTRTDGSLTYIAPGPKPPGFSRGLLLLSLAVAALGILIMVTAGSQMLDGDFTSTSTSMKSGWMTPPIAFGLGLLLSLSPIAIWLQEEGLDPAPYDAWDTVVTLRPGGMSLPTSTSPGLITWGEVTDEMVADVPERPRPAVQHYRDHPEVRAEIGKRTSLVRVTRMSS